MLWLFTLNFLLTYNTISDLTDADNTPANRAHEAIQLLHHETCITLAVILESIDN